MFSLLETPNASGHSSTIVGNDKTKVMHRNLPSSVGGDCTNQNKYPPKQQSYVPSICSPSAPIKIPRTHIPRTHSELQVAQEQIKAELSDIQMYARLHHGMSQAFRDDEKVLHPLTAKSLMGIMSTHNRDYEQEQEHEDAVVEFPELNGWETSDFETISIDESSDKPSKFSECTRSVSIVSNYDHDEDEVDYIFVLEM